MIPDEQLVLAAQSGDDQAAAEILNRFGGFIRTIASAFFDPTGDRDDLLQEARIGALEAVQTWSPDRGASFKSFLTICVSRSLIDATKVATRMKHQTLTHSMREAKNEDGDVVDSVDLIESHDLPIPVHLAVLEEIAEIATNIRTHLSALEAHCLLLFANGLDYATIALLLDSDAKTIDNALQRARTKLADPVPVESLRFRGRRARAVYACPGCGGATVKSKPGRGRPPLCHVCTLRRLAA